MGRAFENKALKAHPHWHPNTHPLYSCKPAEHQHEKWLFYMHTCWMYVNVCVRVCVQMHVCAAMWGLYCHNNYVLDQQWVSGPETGGCPHMRSHVSALMFGKVRKDKSSYVFQGNSKNSRIGCLHRRCKDSLSNVATASSQTTVQSKTVRIWNSAISAGC